MARLEEASPALRYLPALLPDPATPRQRNAVLAVEALRGMPAASGSIPSTGAGGSLKAC
ncbi:MAG: hypothetical protein P9C48_00025 [Defluviicoccus sp.]|nr:hypothetical protein [Defluviicoccus sp.]MDG4607499.1 hypothetical protein [Defluviicoccus sp.]